MTTAEEQHGIQIVQREIVLLVIIAVAAVPLYLGTRRVAEMNRHRHAGIAIDLFRRAQRQLASRRPDAAIESLRAAVTNDHNNAQFAFALAQTLAAAGHDEEARVALLRLREAAPEEPGINLELARLAWRHHDDQQAVLYYHHALYGLWTGERIDERRTAVRLELIRLLLERHQRSRALAELLIMSSEAPSSAEAQLDMARLFTEAGDLPRALQHFRAAAEIDPANFTALRGAGETAFELRDYPTSASFLTRALAQRSSPSLAEMLDTAVLVQSRDPLAVHLTSADQVSRLAIDADHVLGRLQECISARRNGGEIGPSSLDKLYSGTAAVRSAVSSGVLRHDPDLLRTSIEEVLTAAETTSAQCGAPAPFDRALLLVARQHKSSAP